ncbi:type III-A CRISPR-associated protein Cas10/Csm1 [Bacillota bacterium]
MNEGVFNVTTGALLHDIGKVVFRCGSIDSRAHPESGYSLLKEYIDSGPILDSVRYHHKRDLLSADIKDNSIAHIVYIADNIASGVDRREIEGDGGSAVGFDRNLPLSSIFNLLNNNNGKEVYPFIHPQNAAGIPKTAPGANISISESEYNSLLQDYKLGLKGIEILPEYLDSILELNEAYLSYVPSSTQKNQVADISLHDHQKVSAAIASCIYQYLEASGRNNYRKELVEKEKDFYKEDSFLMFSCDFSGIQSFIYTITSKAALKGLRARSFYLDIMMEHIMDSLLRRVGLSRANIIYTGGGHAYAILPNTKEAGKAVKEVEEETNKWLMDKFGAALYLAVASKECSGSDLMNQPAEKEPYRQIFMELSERISRKKLHRYDYDQIIILNTKKAGDEEGRECSVCGSVDRLVDSIEDRNICKSCHSLEKISPLLIKGDMVFMTADREERDWPALELPGYQGESRYLHILSKEDFKGYIKENPERCQKVYGKNERLTGHSLATKLWLGEYSKKTERGSLADFKELSESSSGIDRLGVIRADVDDLGAAFISGFVRADEKNVESRNRYVTLSRYATFSRQLSQYFKYHINGIAGGYWLNDNERFMLGSGGGGERSASIVYSGGDDLFVVGAWDEIIEIGVELKRSFRKYSQGTLTLSGGIGVFGSTYPISRMADETGELEKQAKNVDRKNAVSLFGKEHSKSRNGESLMIYGHTYPWDSFETKVIGEKYRLLQRYFGTGDEAGSTSMLYRLLVFIRESENDVINIARCAYMLGRMAPSDKAGQEKQTAYKELSSRIFEWIRKPEDRRELITAIVIFVYYNRESQDR